MQLQRHSLSLLLAVSMVALPGIAGAQDLGSLKNALGGGQQSGLSSASTGNVAGIIEYCIKNNYLSGGAGGIQNQLLGKLGGKQAADQDEGYQSGLQGMLLGKDGQRSELGGGSTAGTSKLGGLANAGGVKDLKDKAVRKGCDMVLEQGKSLL